MHGAVTLQPISRGNGGPRPHKKKKKLHVSQLSGSQILDLLRPRKLHLSIDYINQWFVRLICITQNFYIKHIYNVLLHNNSLQLHYICLHLHWEFITSANYTGISWSVQGIPPFGCCVSNCSTAILYEGSGVTLNVCRSRVRMTLASICCW